MRIWFSLSCCLLIACPLVGFAEPHGAFIETLPNGSIHWSDGVLMAHSRIFSDTPSDTSSVEGGPSKEAMLRRSREASIHQLLVTMAHIRMDAFRYVGHVMSADPKVAARAAEMAAAASVIDAGPSDEAGGVAVQVQMSMLGPLAQLVLPESIKPVESIKSFTPAAPGNTASGSPELRTPPEEPNVFTGLVVDARGTGARPAMVPMLVDENGREIFGSAFVSRDYAVQQGVCMYVSALDKPERHPRVGPKPLVVKGLHTLEDRNCDVVISNADAAKLRDASANLGFLKKCRVIIILDP
ncbi:hypothetical protein [Desulfatitalea tepidiphila]|uniref:hypothetical protein n=1 Tax=Desulfatitalea tepidiphila TaxID=1185843 RepID=UPI0006B62105|nr:hypothetical protein [Desulfatitalea tepidiphila]